MVTKEQHLSKRHNHASTQTTEKRKLAVQISNLNLWTSHVGARGLVSELWPHGCLSILPLIKRGAKAERTLVETHVCELVCEAKDFHPTRTFPCVTQPETRTTMQPRISPPRLKCLGRATRADYVSQVHCHVAGVFIHDFVPRQTG